jgi:hypothetical protein
MQLPTSVLAVLGVATDGRPGRVCLVAIRKLSGGLLLLPLSRAKGEAWAPASNYVLPVSAARAASQP